jgi:MFS family permease
MHCLKLDIASTLGTPIYVAAIPSTGEHFHVGTTLAIAPLSFYAYGIGIGALLGTVACAVFGRRIVYQITLPLCLVFTVVGGSAKTFATIAIARSLAGLFAGPSLTVGSGIVNDLWDVSLDKTGSAFAVGLGMFIMWATLIGPMVSASLLTYHSWRWAFWMPAILIGITADVAFMIPETYMPQILRSHAQKEKAPATTERTSLDRYLVSVRRPLHMILNEPVCRIS